METTTTATKTTHYIDPGLKFGVDIERASLFIGRAAEWAEDSRERRIERNSLGWKILRSYTGLPSQSLEDMGPKRRYQVLTEFVHPRLVFGTPRPAWAFKTHYEDLFSEGAPECTHSRDLMNTPEAVVSIQRVDSLDANGQLVSHGPSVVVQVDAPNMSPHALLALARACRAVSEQLAWIGRA